MHPSLKPLKMYARHRKKLQRNKIPLYADEVPLYDYENLFALHYAKIATD